MVNRIRSNGDNGNNTNKTWGMDPDDGDTNINEVLELLWSPNRWCRFPFDFLATMSSNEAILLSFLINHAFKYPKKRAAAGGWFYCRISTVTRTLHWSVNTQNNAFRRLIRAKFIQTERQGNPPKRWVWIDMVRIWKAVNMNLQTEYDDEDED